MDNIFQRFQKKLSSSEKKINDRISNCRLGKAFRHAVAPPPPAQPITPTCEEWDQGIVVARPPPIVRLILFKELGDCDRPILFDSKSFEKTESNNDLPGAEKYHYVRSPPDWKVLSEMLFGSVGMTQKAASLKIHSIKSPPSIMLSRVFCLSPREYATVSLDRGIENSFEAHRAISISSRRKANTMPVPLSSSVSRAIIPNQSLASSFSSQTGGHFPRSDSGISLASMASSSYQPSTPSYPIGSLSSVSATLTSSGSHGKSHSLPKNNKRDSFTVSDEFMPNEKFLRRTRTRIGFAVICVPEPSNLKEFQRFFFEHFPIIESHMTALKENIEKAFQLRPKGNFIDLMMKALDEFTSKLHAIYSSQRLPEPVWSTLNSPQLVPKHRQIVVESFIGDLSRLVSDYNAKQRNCFVTSLLTAVLTYHLGWVASVSPAQAKDNYDKEDEYNALWAQLGDLYGAVGSPTRVCRTVVTGSCHELVSTFLSVLSYFIRSSRVDDVIDVPASITPYTMGVTEPPPMLKVSVETVPCDMDESDDYVLISVVEDDEKEPENPSPKELSISSTQKPSKSPILRSKSSPNKPKKDVQSRDEDDDEQSSLTRSYSGPMIRRSQRPRSNAMVENRLSARHRTFSNNILSKPRGVQSRRRSHDTADVSMTSSNSVRHNLSKTTDGDITKVRSCLNMQESYRMQECDMTELVTSDQANPSSWSNPDLPANEIRKVASFVDIIEPRKETLVQVQRSAVLDRTRDLFFNETDNFFSVKSRTNIEPKLPLQDEIVAEHKSPIINSCKSEKDTPERPQNLCISKDVSKTKIIARRRPLPHSTKENFDEDTFKSDFPIKNSKFQKPSYLRIPSVEMNHNDFEPYFDNDSSESSEQPLYNGDEVESFNQNNLTHHVISCPNFRSLQTNNTILNSSALKVQPIYPKLDETEIDSPITNLATVEPSKTQRLYPTLPEDIPFDSVTFYPNSERVSLNRQNSTSSDMTSSNLPPKPTTLRLNSVQSNRTVTVTDELLLNDQLQELPLADMNYNHPERVGSQDLSDTPTGFASLMADYGQEYMNDFILHGAPNQGEMHKKILADLEHEFKNSTLDEPVSESVCILADTDNCSVKVYRSHRLHEDPPCLPALSSKLVCNILNRIATMAKMKMSPEFCMIQLESELRQLVLKSHVLAEYTLGRKRITMSQLSAALNIESRDLPLLMSIASCHSPHVARMMM